MAGGIKRSSANLLDKANPQITKRVRFGNLGMASHTSGPKISAAYDDPGADVVLVSSDESRFRVHSFHLMSGSAVFRDMLLTMPRKDENPITIELTDHDDENEAAVTDFLDYLTHRDEYKHTTDSYRRTCTLIRLLHKYDCPSAIKALSQSIRLSRIDKPDLMDPFHAFKISMKLEDTLGCAEAIRKARNLEWDSGLDDARAEGVATLMQPIYKGHAFDVSTWSVQEMEDCPTRYVCALARAWRQYSKFGREKRQEALNAVADEFHRLMTA